MIIIYRSYYEVSLTPTKWMRISSVEFSKHSIVAIDLDGSSHCFSKKDVVSVVLSSSPHSWVGDL